MGAESKRFVKETVDSVKKAMDGVGELLKAVSEADKIIQTMTPYLKKASAHMKNNPGKTAGELEVAIPEMKKINVVIEHQQDLLAAEVLKLDDAFPNTKQAIAHARKVIADFEKHCVEKSRKWNPLSKKSLGGNLRVIVKAKADMEIVNTGLGVFETEARHLELMK